MVLIAPGFFQRKPSFLSYTCCAPIVNFAARRFTQGRESNLRRAHRKDFELNAELVKALVAPSRTPGAKEAMAACMRAQEPPYMDVISTIRVPVHFVWAD